MKGTVFFMEAIVRLYGKKRNEISRFLNNFYKTQNEESEFMNLLEWEKKYQNPVEIAEIIGTFIDNNDKYSINMWISLDAGVFININDNNANEIIKYIYERYPY